MRLPPGDKQRSLIIIPVLNEAATIIATINDVRSHVDNCDIVVVDSYSTDGTTELVHEAGIPIVQTPRGGKGLAVRRAFRQLLPECRHHIWIMMDGDYTYPGDGATAVRDALTTGRYDAVIGWRAQMDPGAMSWVNRVGNRALSQLASRLYGFPIRDLCSGMWGFTRHTVAKMNLISCGFTLEADLFSNVVRTRCRIGQVPISYRARPDGSKSKLKVMDCW